MRTAESDEGVASERAVALSRRPTRRRSRATARAPAVAHTVDTDVAFLARRRPQTRGCDRRQTARSCSSRELRSLIDSDVTDGGCRRPKIGLRTASPAQRG